MRCAITNRRMHDVCARARAATKNAAEADKLGNRTSSALDFLLRYRQLSYILEAVITLGKVTSLTHHLVCGCVNAHCQTLANMARHIVDDFSSWMADPCSCHTRQ